MYLKLIILTTSIRIERKGKESKMKTENSNKLLTRKEAAELLGTTEGTLAVWACNKRYNLPIVKVGRLVKYRLSDLMNFIEENTTGKKGKKTTDKTQQKQKQKLFEEFKAAFSSVIAAMMDTDTVHINLSHNTNWKFLDGKTFAEFKLENKVDYNHLKALILIQEAAFWISENPDCFNGDLYEFLTSEKKEI